MTATASTSPIAHPDATIPTALKTLRLPSMARLWSDLARRAERDDWTHTAYLAGLLAQEVADRDARRLAARLEEAKLPPGKRLDSFQLDRVPSLRPALVDDLVRGEWVARGGNLLAFGPSGTGKTHFCAALGARLIERGYRVLFTRVTDLVQRLQAARRDFTLPGLLAKLDKFDCLILDDLGYARKDQAETGVLFDLIAERYERRSLMITCNQPFAEWGSVFPDQAMTTAAIDRLVHHAIILEFDADSFRRASAQARLAKAKH